MKTWTTKNGCRIIRVLTGRSNVFLLLDGKKKALIDTSVKMSGKTLLTKLDNLHVAYIDYLVLTHSHFDHAANACEIKEKYGAQVLIHRNEAANLTSGEFAVVSGTNWLTRAIMTGLADKLSPVLSCPPCGYDHLVDSYFDMKESGFNAFLLHTPGHSPGSISLIVDDEIALVGDAMIGISKCSVFPPFAQDVKQLLQSWRRLLETGCQVFLPAHGSANSRSLLEKDYKKRNLL
jgi:hydroxyacylglutathione hydrolase